MKLLTLVRISLIAVVLTVALPLQGEGFRAGVAEVDVSPPFFPVLRNGSFIEGSETTLLDPLFARAFVLEDHDMTLAIVVVDSCMLPRDFCDRVKALAVRETGLRADRILISATHTHAAPGVMDYCLGSRADPRYSLFLPGKIAEAIRLAQENLEPAEVAWGRVDAGEFTANRRWISRPDKVGLDPFGEQTVRAMMHPGHGNDEYLGPSGPIDPWLSFLSIRNYQGRVLGVLANFSMHYFKGHPGISADYFGEFARLIKAEWAQGEEGSVVAMSQGTSGDLWWGDYRLEARQTWTLEEYTAGLVERLVPELNRAEYRRDIDLAMAEERLNLARRLPDAQRLAWAAAKMTAMNGKRPGNRPDVYAEQAFFLRDNPVEEVVLQVIRVGEVALTGIPNEVYALTGLKLKAMSPSELTFNMSLANGAAGYIPPPEQHDLGGYTTWPARTAGLEVEAEPKIVSALGILMERVTGRSLKPYSELEGGYAATVRESRPTYRWRMGDPQRQLLRLDADAHYVGPTVFYLDGVAGQGFGGAYDSRAAQFVGGHFVVPDLECQDGYALEFWFYNALASDLRSVTGTLFSWGRDRLEISGNDSEQAGRLKWGDILGKTPIRRRHWNHVVVSRRGDEVHVYLNGGRQPDLSVREARPGETVPMYLAGSPGQRSTLEGRIDEVSFYSRGLSLERIVAHYQAAGR